MTTPSASQEQIWQIAVPRRQEFTEPPFHFGERVKWHRDDEQGQWQWFSGRIVGMRFILNSGWFYTIWDDHNLSQESSSTSELWLHEADLQLVKDSASVRMHLQSESVWLPTAKAAQQLGLSHEQLRRLRRSGLLKVGVHCRDTSVPGSGLPRWQWHIEKCAQAMAIPPEKRFTRRTRHHTTP